MIVGRQWLMKKVYNALTKSLKAMGEKNPANFFNDPDSDEYKQQQQINAQRQQEAIEGQKNQLAEAAEVEGMADIQKEQMKSQISMIKAQFDAEQKERDRQFEAFQKERDKESKENIEIMKSEIAAMIEGLRVDIGKPGIGAELE